MVKQLPVVKFRHKLYFLDGRLGQIRNIEDPSDFLDLGQINHEEFEDGG
jgi:hypothetical protein